MNEDHLEGEASDWSEITCTDPSCDHVGMVPTERAEQYDNERDQMLYASKCPNCGNHIDAEDVEYQLDSGFSIMEYAGSVPAFISGLDKNISSLAAAGILLTVILGVAVVGIPGGGSPTQTGAAEAAPIPGSTGYSNDVTTYDARNNWTIYQKNGSYLVSGLFDGNVRFLTEQGESSSDLHYFDSLDAARAAIDRWSNFRSEQPESFEAPNDNIGQSVGNWTTFETHNKTAIAGTIGTNVYFLWPDMTYSETPYFYSSQSEVDKAIAGWEAGGRTRPVVTTVLQATAIKHLVEWDGNGKYSTFAYTDWRLFEVGDEIYLIGTDSGSIKYLGPDGTAIDSVHSFDGFDNASDHRSLWTENNDPQSTSVESAPIAIGAQALVDAGAIPENHYWLNGTVAGEFADGPGAPIDDGSYSDADNDGVPDSEEGRGDIDDDGVPNYADEDTDGDGIPDSVEGTGDPDDDGIPNYKDTDSDGDGLPDSFEGTGDADQDGIPDYLDSDFDGDGVPDTEDDDRQLEDDDEIPAGSVSPDSGGQTDTDGDGVPDSKEGDGDIDGDGTPNYADGDTDGDGIPDSVEGTDDTDGDGTPAYKDPDESGDYDAPEDGEDSDNDGVPDSKEGDGDLDGDGTPNHSDDDTDGDGIQDGEEGTGDVDGDGTPNYKDPDSDGDGIPDNVEGTGDADGDGIPNYKDPDSDGDGIPDSVEGTGDADGDGIPDYKDPDSDGDGIPDSVEGTEDTDGDGIPNYKDPDSDGDGVPDSEEGTNDSDGDGIPDYKDPDTDGSDYDNDGTDDEDQYYNGNRTNDGSDDPLQGENVTSNDGASISGTVTDSSGNEVEGATVAVNSDPIRVKTSSDGSYSISNISSGVHEFYVIPPTDSPELAATSSTYFEVSNTGDITVLNRSASVIDFATGQSDSWSVSVTLPEERSISATGRGSTLMTTVQYERAQNAEDVTVEVTGVQTNSSQSQTFSRAADTQQQFIIDGNRNPLNQSLVLTGHSATNSENLRFGSPGSVRLPEAGERSSLSLEVNGDKTFSDTYEVSGTINDGGAVHRFEDVSSKNGFVKPTNPSIEMSLSRVRAFERSQSSDVNTCTGYQGILVDCTAERKDTSSKTWTVPYDSEGPYYLEVKYDLEGDTGDSITCSGGEQCGFTKDSSVKGSVQVNGETVFKQRYSKDDDSLPAESFGSEGSETVRLDSVSPGDEVTVQTRTKHNAGKITASTQATLYSYGEADRIEVVNGEGETTTLDGVSFDETYTFGPEDLPSPTDEKTYQIRAYGAKAEYTLQYSGQIQSGKNLTASYKSGGSNVTFCEFTFVGYSKTCDIPTDELNGGTEITVDYYGDLRYTVSYDQRIKPRRATVEINGVQYHYPDDFGVSGSVPTSSTPRLPVSGLKKGENSISIKVPRTNGVQPTVDATLEYQGNVRQTEQPRVIVVNSNGEQNSMQVPSSALSDGGQLEGSYNMSLPQEWFTEGENTIYVTTDGKSQMLVDLRASTVRYQNIPFVPVSSSEIGNATDG